MTRKGLILNIDINSVVKPFLNRTAAKPGVGRADLYPFVDQYRDTQVTALAFDIFCQYSATPSKVWSDACFKYEQKTENGMAVDYRDYYEGVYTFHTQYGIDPWEVWFARCREVGMEAWMSVRMNDCHCPLDETCFLRSDFFYTARENGWMVGLDYGLHYHYCFDYAVPEIRVKMLAYIEEQIMRYNVDALELDFQRELACFRYDQPDKAEIMTGFLRSVRKLTVQAGEKWGHKVKLTVRLMRDPEQNLAYGFDAAAWVKEALVDHICVAPRWQSCDEDMPIADWKARFPGMEISAGLETLVSSTGAILKNADVDMVNGLAAAYWEQGADAVYLYNYYTDPDVDDPHNRRTQQVIRLCGDAALSGNAPRSVPVMFQDMAPPGMQAYRPLPADITETGMEFRVNSGTSDRPAYLVFGLTEGDPAEMHITVNGADCGAAEKAEIRCCLENEINPMIPDEAKLYRCAVPGALTGQHPLVRFAGKGKLVYLEIRIP